MQAHLLSSSAAHLPSGPVRRSPSHEAGALLHDLNNLLGALQLYADLLDRPGVLQTEHHHYAAELHTLAERSRSLLGPLTGRQPSSRADLRASLRELTPLLKRLAAPSTLVVEIAPSLPPAAVSAEALHRIALNLTVNAAAALANSGRRHQGTIRITLDAAPGLRLTIADNGPGLPLANALSLLAGRTSPRARRGRGLPIVHDLARESGAALEVHARQREGTQITLLWPLLPGHTLPTEEPRA